MADPHTPLLSDFNLSEVEVQAVEAALDTNNPWDDTNASLTPHQAHLKSIKDRLVEFHSERQHGACCYCRNHLAERGPFVRDREHILPKHKYKTLSYKPFNLSFSCKRCNMEIKGMRYDFVIEPNTILDDPQNSDRYQFIHPNFDNWSDYISIIIHQENNDIIVHYHVKSDHPKAQYTYDYFKLSDLSVDTFDAKQGEKVIISIIRNQISELENQFGQV